MRRPQQITGALPHKQRGFSLFIVLIVMIIIAFLAVAATQSYNTEMRISSNDADRKIALSVAEAALRQGESDIAAFTSPSFTADCTDGLCSAAGQAASSVTTSTGTITLGADSTAMNAWQRTCGTSDSSCLETNGLTYSASGVSQNPRYIIEFVNTTTDSDGVVHLIYRVTSRAWGQNANTAVTLQSFVEVQN